MTLVSPYDTVSFKTFGEPRRKDTVVGCYAKSANSHAFPAVRGPFSSPSPAMRLAGIVVIVLVLIIALCGIGGSFGGRPDEASETTPHEAGSA